MGEHRLTWLERKLPVVEEDRDLVGLEGYEAGDASDLRPGLQVGPRRPPVLADVVVAAQTLVGTEGLDLDGDQRAPVDVLPGYVPARCEPGLEQHPRPPGVCDHLRPVLDDQVP